MYMTGYIGITASSNLRPLTEEVNSFQNSPMKKRIAWFVPFPIQGSGGHQTIFNHIQTLMRRGHHCYIFIGKEKPCSKETSLQQLLFDDFGFSSDYVHYGYDTHEKFDMAVATAWWTAEGVVRNVHAEKKVYFIQDYEPWFNPMGDLFLKAEQSYRYGLSPITIGRWLAQKIEKKSNITAQYFDFTADLTTYFPLKKRKKENSICCIFQPDKPRRCPELMKETLSIIRENRPDTKIYTYGSTENPKLPFCEHLGILSKEACNSLYNRCRVGMCLSSTNPSRIPFEMMAAGLPVVELYGENTIYDFPEKATLLAARTSGSLAGAVMKILESETLQQKMELACLDFIKTRPIELEFEQSAQIFESLLQNAVTEKDTFLHCYNAPAFEAEYALPQNAYQSNENAAETERNSNKSTSLTHYLLNNRIARMAKVMWKGYY